MTETDPDPSDAGRAHWRANLRVMGVLLAVWFAVPYLLGIVFVEPLNRFHLGGFPLGFWFAQQGSIYVFVVLVAVYAVWMDRVDRRFARAERAQSDSAEPGKRPEAARSGPQASEGEGRG